MLSGKRGAERADQLFVISEQLGRFVTAHWGVDPKRIALLPNCVDPDRIQPAQAGEVEPDTIGYAGSLIGYEGLDTLIEAVALLREAGRLVRVYVVAHRQWNNYVCLMKSAS